MAKSFISRMAITNDLSSIFCWVSQMASSYISRFIQRGRGEGSFQVSYYPTNSRPIKNHDSVQTHSSACRPDLGRRHVLRLRGAASGCGRGTRTAAASAPVGRGVSPLLHLGVGRGRNTHGQRLVSGLFVWRHCPRGALHPHHAGRGVGDDGDLRLRVLRLLRAVQLACRKTTLERGGTDVAQNTQTDRRQSGVGFADRVRGGYWHGVGISWLAVMRLAVNEVGHFGILSPDL